MSVNAEAAIVNRFNSYVTHAKRLGYTLREDSGRFEVSNGVICPTFETIDGVKGFLVAIRMIRDKIEL